MKGTMVIRILVVGFLCVVVFSSGCSFPYKVDTGRTPSSELAKVYLDKAEVVMVDAKTVSVKKALFPAHLVIKQGTHEMTVNYWEKMVFSSTPKKIKFNAKPGKQYRVACQKVRAGKAIDKKAKDPQYIFKRKGNEYLQDKEGYYYTYECCLKDKETNESLGCK
jgi:hypothetical protein